MATIQIADNDARVQYTQAVTANTTQLTIDFPFFDLDDINVIVTTAAGVDTVLSRGTGTGTFAVTGTSVEDGYSGGYITLGDSYSAGTDTFTIFRDIPITRTTDFPTSGPFNVASLNTELDKLTAIAQQNETSVSRTLQLSDSDTTVDLKLPNLNTRKGKTLAFNTTTGVPEAGPSISDVQTISAAAADIATLADIEDGTEATDAISTVAGISSDVTTVSGISANVTTVSGISSDVTAVAADATDIGVVATDLAGTDTIGTVAGSISNVNTVATNISSVNTNATNISSINTNATNITDIQNASANAASALASKNAAATSETNAATSASSASTSASTATTKAAEASTSATNAATSETNAATSASNAATSATNAATSETNAASSATSASSSASAAAASAAAAASTYDTFDDRYLGSYASNPTVDNDGDPLTAGALYFNSTDNEMRVYDGAQWIAASAASQTTFSLFEYTATASQTTFSGTDDNGATMSYTAPFIIVAMNGVILDPSDYTATNGTSVVLATGAALNDIVNVYAFGSFAVADTVPASTGGTFQAGITVNGTVAATSYTGDGSSLTGIAAGATGGGSDEIFWENGQTVTTNYTITNGKNAMSAGPITINTGVTVTVGTGETWTVV